VVAAVVEASGALKYFSFAPMDTSESYNFSALYHALRKLRSILEVINLSSGFNFAGSIDGQPIGSFSDFHRLRRVHIPDMVRMETPNDHRQRFHDDYIWMNSLPRIPLVELLPASLKALVLAAEFTVLSDDTEFLTDFAKSLDRLPKLKIFGVEGCYEETFVKLYEALIKHGVKFGRD
jgi:hypothetical protein